MSQPTNGGYEGQGNSLGREFGNQQQSQGGSLGSEYGSSWSQGGEGGQPAHDDRTQQVSTGQSYDQQGQGYGQSGQQGSQYGGQQGYGQPSQGSYEQQNQQGYGQSGQQGSYEQYDQNQQGYGQSGSYQQQQPAKSSSPSVFSDTKFEHVLTPKIASLTFMLVAAGAVLWGLTDIIHGFVGDSWSGGNSDLTIKMKVFPAILNLLADVAIVGAVIFGARVLLELAINVAKRADRD